MTDFEKLVREAIADISENLEGYATRAAMIELSYNWREALEHGAKPWELVGDIDGVIAKLTVIKERIR